MCVVGHASGGQDRDVVVASDAREIFAEFWDERVGNQVSAIFSAEKRNGLEDSNIHGPCVRYCAMAPGSVCDGCHKGAVPAGLESVRLFSRHFRAGLSCSVPSALLHIRRVMFRPLIDLWAT